MEFVDQVIAAMELLARRDMSGKMPSSTSELYWHMGIDTPDVRKLARRFSKAFCEHTWSNQVRIVQHLLNYGSDEMAHLGVFLLSSSVDDMATVDVRALDSMIGAFRGWSVTDAFCIEVLQPLLEQYTTDVLALLADWATAESRWKRRASVVVFTRKIGAGGHYTRQGLAACERLITDSDDLVRKGIGWALKDLMRGDRETVLDYVLNLRRRGVSSVITLYALRDVQGAERQRILAQQREADSE